MCLSRYIIWYKVNVVPALVQGCMLYMHWYKAVCCTCTGTRLYVVHALVQGCMLYLHWYKVNVVSGLVQGCMLYLRYN